MRTRSFLLVVGTLFLVGAPPLGGQSVQLAYVGSQRQLGPVAYRDPLGTPSPDGRWLATTAGLRLYLRPLVGGPVVELGPGTQRVNELVWAPDSQLLYTHESNYARTHSEWYEYDPATGARRESRLLDPVIAALPDGPGASSSGDLRALSFASGGAVAAAVLAGTGGQTLYRVDLGEGIATGQMRASRIWATAWHPDGTIGCVHGQDRMLSLDCGGALVDLAPDIYGPIAFDPEGVAIAARPDDTGTLDLWEMRRDQEPRRLTRFARDAYAPTVLANGEVVFRVQEYRIFLATVAAAGGSAAAVTAFQSETPSWDWTGTRLAFTYGSWRRIIDDAHYPDISQHVGIVELDRDLPAAAPHHTVRSSYSEDQGMHWSPNGRWIVLHSHADGTDDLWLQPADGSAAAHPITGGGYETGWPRWSADGATIIYPTEVDDGAGGRRGALMTLGIDPETGAVTVPATALPMTAYGGSVTFAEFAPSGDAIYFESNDGIGERSIRRVQRRGGQPELVHAFKSRQWFSGIGVSPDGAWIAFIAPGPDGYFQVFRVSTVGGSVEQLTSDPTDKTQPTWSPGGDQVAFSTFTYQSHFWRLRR
jgi:Tol biopolymer transport system component